jgi:hypothetical protein
VYVINFNNMKFISLLKDVLLLNLDNLNGYNNYIRDFFKGCVYRFLVFTFFIFYVLCLLCSLLNKKMSIVQSEMPAVPTSIQKQNKAPGRKPKEVWNYFIPTGKKKEGHQGCKCNYCPWSQTRGEPNSMEAHLALSCHKVPIDVKEKFLLTVKARGETQTLGLEAITEVSKKRKIGNQQLITKFTESDTIEPVKQELCDHAVAKFFICCGISFRLVEHPFFINMAKSLCLGYKPPSAHTLSEDFLYTELANIVVDQRLILKRTRNLTLGKY